LNNQSVKQLIQQSIGSTNNQFNNRLNQEVIKEKREVNHHIKKSTNEKGGLDIIIEEIRLWIK
jgi:hypothetical protein